MYLLNAFSLQMISEFPTNVKFEEGKRIIVVSDIHGDLTTFKKLLNK